MWAASVPFKYRTYMNTLAISPHICMCFLQQSNVQRKTTHIRKETEKVVVVVEKVEEEKKVEVEKE